MRSMMASLAALVALLGSPAVLLGQAQEAIDVNIAVTDRGGAWYADPVWIAIGIIGVVLLVVIVAMAARGGGTTVVRD
jgi:hypothetical protein